MDKLAQIKLARIEAIEDPDERARERWYICAEDAIGRIINLQLPPEPWSPEIFIYDDGSYLAIDWRDQNVHALERGQHLVIDAIVRACSELPKACPCPLTICTEPHHRCCKCGTNQDLVSGPHLPLALRRAWCKTCWNRWLGVPYDFPRGAAEPESPNA